MPLIVILERDRDGSLRQCGFNLKTYKTWEGAVANVGLGCPRVVAETAHCRVIQSDYTPASSLCQSVSPLTCWLVDVEQAAANLAKKEAPV